MLAEDLTRRGLVSTESSAIAVAGCVMLGGYGHQLSPRTRCSLLFEASGLRVTPSESRSLVLTIPYDSMTALEVSGRGLLRSGGGFGGGGLGVTGAAEGLAIASVLNLLTTKSSMETLVGVKTATSEIIVANLVESPQQLRLRLAQAIGWFEAVRESRVGGDRGKSASEELAQLGELHAKGVLTSAEFEAAKHKVISRM